MDRPIELEDWPVAERNILSSHGTSRHPIYLGCSNLGGVILTFLS